MVLKGGGVMYRLSVVGAQELSRPSSGGRGVVTQTIVNRPNVSVPLVRPPRR